MIVVIHRGDVVEPVDLNGRPEPTMVLSPCQHSALGYFCAACVSHFANLYNLELHLEAGGHHAVCAYCSTCRLYREADARLIESIDPSHKLAL